MPSDLQSCILDNYLRFWLCKSQGIRFLIGFFFTFKKKRELAIEYVCVRNRKKETETGTEKENELNSVSCSWHLNHLST